MACTKFEYVKQFEQDVRALPNCWLVVRVDGRSFEEFAARHCFKKPNDDRALRLMNHSAREVMNQFGDIVLAYGQSDEYSFVFRKATTMWNRRQMKIATNLVSLFSASFVRFWPAYFPFPLKLIPSFDARVICYPGDDNLRDYLAWRQADCHINNQFNVCFWALVNNGKHSREEAFARLKGTQAKDKNELLFAEFGINYNNLPPLHRKGSVIVRHPCDDDAASAVVVEASSFEPKQEEERGSGLGGVDGHRQSDNIVDGPRPCIDDGPRPCIDDGQGLAAVLELNTRLLAKQSSEEMPAPVFSLGEADLRKMQNIDTFKFKSFVELNVDIIGDVFWERFPFLLSPTKASQRQKKGSGNVGVVPTNGPK